MVEYPREWKRVKIKDVLSIGHGKDYKGLPQGDIPVYGTGGYMCSVDAFLHDGPTVCIGRKGTIDKPMYFDGKIWTVDTLFYTHDFIDVIPEFIYHKFTTIKWLDYNAASGVPSLTAKTIEDIEIPLPPLPEQRRIAAALGDMDKLIENLGKRIAKKRLIKKGAMQELLTGKKRLPGFSGEWKEVCVGDVGYFYGGLSGKTASDFGHGNAHYITFLNVLNNVVIDKNCVCDVVVGETEKQNLVKRNDLFFNGSSETPEEVAMCAALLEDLPNTYLNSFCCGFRLKGEEFLPLFISYYYNSEVGRRLISTMAQGLTRYNLSKKSFLAAKVMWPERPEQKAIARVLSDMDAEIASLERRQAKLKLIKKGMLQDLLTGKVRI